MKRIGCQTITFADDHETKLPQLLRSIADAGFRGVEIGYRRIKHLPPRELQELLDAAGLELLGLHVGGNLEDKSQARAECSMLDEVLDYQNAMGTELLIYSGPALDDAEKVKQLVAELNRSAERCRERGVQLLYHNHDREFLHDSLMFDLLVDAGNDALGFCPDLGWAHKAGIDTGALVQRLGRRIGAVHYKDYLPSEGPIHTVPLGEGCVPFDAATQLLMDDPRDLWIIAEQDNHDGDKNEAVRRNARYLKTRLGDMHV